MGKVSKKIKANIYAVAVLIAAAIYSIYFSVASIFRYNNYYTGRFDLGNMAQTVWNSLHGNIFMMTDPNQTREVSRLAFHSDFILILLSPLYLIWEDPRILLIFQSVIVSLGGIFVYLLANNILKNKTISLVLAVSYFLNPAINFANLYEFHSVTLSTTFFLAAFYFISKKEYLVTLIFLFLAGITKEEVWVLNVLIGAYLFFVRKQRLIGGVLSVFSAVFFYILIWIAMPKALGGQHFAIDFYKDYGDSPATVIKNMILHPVQDIRTLLLPDRIGFIKQIFMPLGYLSLLGIPFLIFASPELAINLLSNYPPMHQLYYQYSATISPFIFISAIFGIKYLKDRFAEFPLNAISLYLLFMTIISSYLFGPLPYAKRPNLDMFRKPLANREVVDNYIKSIPATESISATNNLGSHLSHRRQIYVIPKGIDIADRIMFLTASMNGKEQHALNLIKNNPDYILIKQNGSFYVFRKR